jgi:hypothetical protein
MIVGCVGASIWGGILFLDGQATNYWPNSKGKIIESKYFGEVRDASTSWKVKIKYHYQVAGVDYFNDKIAIGYIVLGKQHALVITEKYPKDSEVTVMYNQENPEDAVLESGVHLSSYIGLVFSFVFLLGAIFSIRRLQRS